MFCYFLRNGNLPLRAKRSEKAKLLIEFKRETQFEDLLEGCPQEFIDYMNYIRNLAFDAKPDYTGFIRSLEGLLAKNGYEMDYEYDWVARKQQMLRELQSEED